MNLPHTNFLKTSDGQQIFYSTTIDPLSKSEARDVLLFNYGLVCSDLHWKYQLDFFQSRGYHIIIHDYRGHFRSSGADDIESITFQRIGQDIIELLQHLKVTSTIAIGHSMGVNISLELGRMAGELLSGMVLISGTVMPVKDVMFNTNLMEFITPIGEAIYQKFPEEFKKIWSTSGLNPLTTHLIHSQGFNTKKVDMDFIEIYLNRVAQLGPDLFFQLFKQMSYQDILGHLADIHVPCLIMGGDKDKVIPNYLQKFMQSKIRNSEYYLIKDGSHVPQVDFPELVNQRMDLFLQKCLS